MWLMIFGGGIGGYIYFVLVLIDVLKVYDFEV